MQTRYHGARYPRSSTNFHCRPYTEMHQTRKFSAPQWEVPPLHQNKDCIFGFYIPVASFWYRYCFSANTVPCCQVTKKFRKVPLSVLYGDEWNPKVCCAIMGSSAFATKPILHFGDLHSRSFLLIYKYCLSANTVPWRKVAPIFRKFPLSAVYGDGLNREVCCLVMGIIAFAPKQGLHFWVLHSHSFLLI